MRFKEISEGLRDPKDNPCWKGYKPVGTKQKAGHTVPNCVPNNESVAEGSITKSIKRGLQGWGSPQDKPADIVKRNKAYDVDTAKKVRAGLDNAPEHTPAGLQKRVLDRKLKGVAEASPETTFNTLKGLKSWQVVIMNNYYRGKYPDYSGRYYYVLASSPEEAKQVVLDNADAILQDLLSMKSVNGRKILPRNSAVPITANRIGEIRDGTEHGRMGTAGFKKMFGPRGPMMVKLTNGAIADIQGQEQGVAEDKAVDPITSTVLNFYKPIVGDIQKERLPDYVEQVKELLQQHRPEPSIQRKLMDIFKKGKENPYIQGGIVTTVGAVLAGGVLNTAQQLGLSPAQTNLALQAILNTVIPTVVSRINGKNWKDTIKYTLASAGIGTGIAAASLGEQGVAKGSGK